jgi:hypothetical protein
VQDIQIAGSNVFVGGTFYDVAGNRAADYIVRWNGSRWLSLGRQNWALKAGGVHAVLIDGASVYIGGGFEDAGDVRKADYIARWDGQRWRAVGSNRSGNDLSAPPYWPLPRRELGCGLVALSVTPPA